MSIDPNNAVDLSKVKDKATTDLSKEAIAKRERQVKLERAAEWARNMNRAFKGITGRRSRREIAVRALMREGLTS